MLVFCRVPVRPDAPDHPGTLMCTTIAACFRSYVRDIDGEIDRAPSRLHSAMREEEAVDFVGLSSLDVDPGAPFTSSHLGNRA